MRYLIVGLGNPGKSYDRTRHNIGFAVVDRIALKEKLDWKKNSKMRGLLAEGIFGGEQLLLLKPETYMNLSGESVLLTLKYYAVDLSCVLVIVDDVDLPLGQLRLKIDSGPGTHNGLKSVEESLQTNRYARLRIGVGDRKEGDLASHVLGKFSLDEESLLVPVLDRAVEAVEIFITKGLTRAMDFANKKLDGPSTPCKGM